MVSRNLEQRVQTTIGRDPLRAGVEEILDEVSVEGVQWNERELRRATRVFFLEWTQKSRCRNVKVKRHRTRWNGDSHRTVADSGVIVARHRNRSANNGTV